MENIVAQMFTASGHKLFFYANSDLLIVPRVLVGTSIACPRRFRIILHYLIQQQGALHSQGSVFAVIKRRKRPPL